MRRLVLLFLLAMLATPSAAQAGTFWLDTHEPQVKRNIGPLRTQLLDKRDPYIAKVRGTFSLFEPKAYQGPHCGTIEPAPLFPSRNVVNGPVNSDVEFLFADVERNCRNRLSTPIVAQTFQIATGKIFRNYKPVTRNPLTGPVASHRYKYALIGKGRRVGFRIPETFGEDNYGRIRIAIRRARTTDCAKGFSFFGYADEAACITAVRAARAS